ncbi:hypothetical protein PMG11_03171 [Penicillium brasilianum]|uniref:Methyltransferase domain-containing protein n=1 Tax=Penicillium brasilianum TaxID=104259 RepID=A0A0F7VGR2_PENBI|nr:hypothetical protein PMG11_03171 [Penicillium brasilianum]
MTQTKTCEKDFWSTETYEAVASFVPHFADTLVQSIDFSPTDRVLDIGCGDGKFTTSFSPAVKYVMGVDSSPAMIEAAKKLDYGGATTDFRVVDCRYLNKEADIVNGSWDKVASNAALHWVLRDPTTRVSTLETVFRSLKPGGTFFFEMCGFGNAPEMVTAFTFALVNHGIAIEKVEETCPWIHPSDDYMKSLLEDIGFQVKMIDLKPKPLKMNADVNGGLEGFMRLLGAPWMDVLETEEKKNSVLKQMCRMLRHGTTKEDGSQWITYYSLRCVAVKPATS